jgi:hypothetical protein
MSGTYDMGVICSPVLGNSGTVVLNIGGTPFTVEKQVLVSEPGSLFREMFTRGPLSKMEDGSIFIGN